MFLCAASPMWSFSKVYIIVKWISFGFKLLLRQNETSEDVTLGFKKFTFYCFLTFYRPKDQEHNPHNEYILKWWLVSAALVLTLWSWIQWQSLNQFIGFDFKSKLKCSPHLVFLGVSVCQWTCHTTQVEQAEMFGCSCFPFVPQLLLRLAWVCFFSVCMCVFKRAFTLNQTCLINDK